MRFLFYTQSLISDWNHGNAHFLRGIMRELIARGHEALALEPEGSWSRLNLIAQCGRAAIDRFRKDFPELRTIIYDDDFAHEELIAEADVVLVHEWNEPSLVERIGRARRLGGRFTLLFHDTHHRAVSAAQDIASFSLDDFDGVLAFGATLRERYDRAGWGRRAFTWHEAADDRLFRPLEGTDPPGKLVWIGNWGDEERTEELETFLIEPVRRLSLDGNVYGVRYPPSAITKLERSGLQYRGWIANADVPREFARHRVTVHVPRRPYVTSLPGIPTIRVFEALACGIPLVSSPWSDDEGLFRAGRDFLVARDGQEMADLLTQVLSDEQLSAELSAAGLETVRKRHTCRHRVSELFSILDEVGAYRPSDHARSREAAG